MFQVGPVNPVKRVPKIDWWNFIRDFILKFPLIDEGGVLLNET